MFLLSFNAFKHRSIFAVFLAIFLLFGAVKGTKAQESNGSAFDGLEKLDGISAEQMMNYASEGVHGTFPTDKSHIFFLYNVKTGLLLNVGGYWGTHVSLQEYGMPLSVYKDVDGWIHFQQDIDKQGVESGNQEGCSLEYFYGEGYASTSIGVFVDRDIYPSTTDKTLKSATYRVSWEFTCKTTKILLLYIFLGHNRNVVNTKFPYPIKRLEVIRRFNQKS
ncbi:hypothetical protein ACTQ1R_14270, partial [Prevotellaceae bacterium LCP21S3_C11]